VLFRSATHPRTHPHTDTHTHPPTHTHTHTHTHIHKHTHPHTHIHTTLSWTTLVERSARRRTCAQHKTPKRDRQTDRQTNIGTRNPNKRAIAVPHLTTASHWGRFASESMNRISENVVGNKPFVLTKRTSEVKRSTGLLKRCYWGLGSLKI
jgi:hypothetical protein